MFQRPLHFAQESLTVAMSRTRSRRSLARPHCAGHAVGGNCRSLPLNRHGSYRSQHRGRSFASFRRRADRRLLHTPSDHRAEIRWRRPKLTAPLTSTSRLSGFSVTGCFVRFLTDSSPKCIIIGVAGGQAFTRGLFLPCLMPTSQVPIPTPKSDSRAEISCLALPSRVLSRYPCCQRQLALQYQCCTPAWTPSLPNPKAKSSV